MTPTTTIPAAHFQKGRSEAISLIVVHTTENACQPGVAQGVAGYFAHPPAGAPVASSHYIVGPETLIQCVDEDDTAWHAAPVNHIGIGIEHTAYAHFTDADWQGEQPQAMLRRSAELVADICFRAGIPAVFVDAEGLLRGDSGITFHATVSEACRLAIARKMTGTIWVSAQHPASPISTHIDPGTAFPWDAYLAMVSAQLPAQASDPPPAEST